MIDERDDLPGPWRDEATGDAAGERRRRGGAHLLREVRESAADRLPLPVRAAPRTVPWRAAVAALLLAVTAAVVMYARSPSTADGATVLPARPALTGPAGPASPAGPGTGAATGSLPADAAIVTAPGASFPTAPGPGTGLASPSAGVASGVVVVDVAGQVRHPGLVRLRPGSRVWDAVTAAGGAVPGARLERLNLARPLTDGEQIVVPGPHDPLPATSPPSAPAPAPAGEGAPRPGGSGRVDLNTATESDLDALPGVGPVLAGRILAWRSQHGRFSRVEELGEVDGIGDKLLSRLVPLVRV